MRIVFFLLFPLVIWSQQTITLTDSDIKAFYTAEGYGRNATGGRGLGVFFVTNTTAANVAGSFQRALIDAQAAGGGTIIFRTGGIIDYTGNGDLNITTSGNITIAGQTAPGGGITLKGAELQISESNVVVRHFRVRQTTASASTYDCFRIRQDGGQISNIVLDHITGSYGGDEVVSVAAGSGESLPIINVTIQNSLIHNGDKTVLFQRAKNISFLKNILALNNQRNIRANTDIHGDLTFEMINNFVYGVNYRTDPSDGLKVTVLDNVYQDSGDFTPTNTIYIVQTTDQNPANGETQLDTDSYYYIDGNIFNGAAATTSNYDGEATTYLQGTPYASSGYSSIGTTGLLSHLIDNAGAYVGTSVGRDDVDQAIISNVAGNTGTISYTGSYGTIASGTPYVDSDGDGLSDEYETANGGSAPTWSVSPTTRPASATLVSGVTIDQSGVTSYTSTGYTHMDFFLGELAGDWGTGTPGGGGTTTPNQLKNATNAMLIAH